MNPFAGYGVVVSGERLVGRERELLRLAERVFSGNGSISVVGMPKIGKTSLVSEAVRRHRIARPGAAVVWLNLSTLNHSGQLFPEVLSELSGELDDAEIATVAETLLRDRASAAEGFRACKRVLKGLKRAGRSATLVIDEFDAIRGFSDANTVINQIRELLYRPSEYGLFGVLVSRRTLPSIEGQTENSVLHGVCEPLFLHPLSKKGLRSLLARAGEDASGVDELSELWSATGGHPYLAEAWMNERYERGEREEYGAFGAVASVLLDHYGYLAEILQEDDSLDQALQLAVGPRWSVRPGVAERLRAYGILVMLETGWHAGWSEHFQLYLERLSRNAEIWDVWRETESGLRDLIEEVLGDALGAEWLSKLASQAPAVATKAESWRSAREREQRVFGDDTPRRLLDYSYPMELWEVMAQRWADFRGILGRDKAYWTERFGVIAKVRNPVAHNREAVIPEATLTQARGYCQEIRERLRTRAAANGPSE